MGHVHGTMTMKGTWQEDTYLNREYHTYIVVSGLNHSNTFCWYLHWRDEDHIKLCEIGHNRFPKIHLILGAHHIWIQMTDWQKSWWRHQMETFSRYWPFVRRIHRSPVNSPHKGQWRGTLMFSLICVWINDWVNNGEAGDLRRYRIHYDVTVMYLIEYRTKTYLILYRLNLFLNH